jgi:hypothetical protein
MPKESAQSNAPVAPTQEDISRRASLLWENYGRPEGRDEEIWLESERQLMGVDRAVEGRDNASMVAISFDEATASGKPKTRLAKPAAASATPKSGSRAARSRR